MPSRVPFRQIKGIEVPSWASGLSVLSLPASHRSSGLYLLSSTASLAEMTKFAWLMLNFRFISLCWTFSTFNHELPSQSSLLLVWLTSELTELLKGDWQVAFKHPFFTFRMCFTSVWISSSGAFRPQLAFTWGILMVVSYFHRFLGCWNHCISTAEAWWWWLIQGI